MNEEIVKEQASGRLEKIAESERKIRPEYSQLFVEHQRLRELIRSASQAARRERNLTAAEVLDVLSHHAKIEEEVLYPAALLAGMPARFILATSCETIPWSNTLYSAKRGGMIESHCK